MSGHKKQYDELILKLSHLKIGCNVDSDLIDNELNSLEHMIVGAEHQMTHVQQYLRQLKVLRIEFDQQMANISPILREMEPLLSKWCQLTQLSRLLDILHTIEHTHQSLQQNTSNIRDKELDTKVILLTDLFKSLTTEYQALSGSKTNFIHNYLILVINYWQNILQEMFTNKLSSLLAAIEWPTLTPSTESYKNVNVETMNCFSLYFKALLDIDVSKEALRKLIDSSAESPVICEPMLVMLTPLKKRFHFHFMDLKSKLNKQEKPEWYLSQVMTWIKENEIFLSQYIDPILKIYLNNGYIPSRFQLIIGLLDYVSIKLSDDLKAIVFDDHLFTHTFDEVLIFSRELLNSEPNINKLFLNSNLMRHFSKEPYFTRILNLERKRSAEFVESILESKTAWTVICGLDCNDDLKICECVDNFVVLLQSITDRSSFLSEMNQRYEFVKLQLEILDDFRLRLTQLLRDCDEIWPLSKRYFAIINTLNYLIIVLEEWKNLPFYVEISEVYTPNETQFDEITALLEHMSNEFVNQIITCFMNQTRSKMHNYETNKWFSIKEAPNSISWSGCELLHFISSNLTLLQKSLSKALFNRVIVEIADQMNSSLLENVVLKNSFSESGAKQFDYDISIGFISLFRIYIPKPELNFAEVNDACKVLNFQRGSAILLEEILKNKNKNKDSKNALKDMGVMALSPHLVLNIIRKRIFT